MVETTRRWNLNSGKCHEAERCKMWNCKFVHEETVWSYDWEMELLKVRAEKGISESGYREDDEKLGRGGSGSGWPAAEAARPIPCQVLDAQDDADAEMEKAHAKEEMDK